MHLWLTDCVCQHLCSYKHPCICTQLTEWIMDRCWKLLLLQNEHLASNILCFVINIFGTFALGKWTRKLQKFIILLGENQCFWVERSHVDVRGLTKRQGANEHTGSGSLDCSSRPIAWGPTRAALSPNWKKSKLPQRMRHPQTNK